MKHVLLFCFLGFGSQATVAQIAIKPAVGINLTDFSKDPNTGKYKSKVGYQFGGSVAIGKRVYIEPGIFWVKKTTQFVTENTSQQDIKYDISGIRVPVTVGFNLLGSEKSVIGLRAFGGASAFMLTDTKNLDKDDLKSADWGVFAGAGLDLAILFVEAKYEWSLTNLTKEISQVDIGKSRSIFVNAGVRIAL
jgi:hypothetical protein